MFKTIFMFLLLIHILGDYYLQSDNLAKQKTHQVLAVIKHCLIYTVICLVAIIPIFNQKIIPAIIALAISHTLIDFAKYFYIRYLKKKAKYLSNKERMLYLSDQFSHLICLFVISYISAANNYVMNMNPIVHSTFEIIGISSITKVLSWVLILLLIWKPTNITIKQLLSLHKPHEENNESDKSAGSFIGVLERLVILILMSINQYSAIGFVLTAKSIARYDRISKDKEFAEYYLLGTLLSTAMSIVIYFVII